MIHAALPDRIEKKAKTPQLIVSAATVGALYGRPLFPDSTKYGGHRPPPTVPSWHSSSRRRFVVPPHYRPL